MLFLLYYCAFFLTILVKTTEGEKRKTFVVADLEITFRSPSGEQTAITSLAVPPVGLRGINFVNSRNFVKFNVSPPGVRCLLRKAMPEEGEGEETSIAFDDQRKENQEAGEQLEPTFSSRNRYIRHLSPVFGRVTEDDDLSSSIDIAPLDQLWKRLLCFQTDGTDIKVLLEFDGGGMELINVRPNRFGWESKEIDGLTPSQRDIVRSTIVQAPSENVECAITGKSVIAFFKKPLKVFKWEKTLYERIPGGAYTYLLCRRANG